MPRQHSLPSAVETGDEALGPEKLDEVLERRTEPTPTHRNVEPLQSPQSSVTVETLDVRELLGGSVNLNVRGATAVGGWSLIVRLVALVPVVLDPNRRAPGQLVDDESEDRAVHSEMVTLVVEANLEHRPQPESWRMPVRETTDDGDQRTPCGRRTFREHPRQLGRPLKCRDHKARSSGDRPVDDVSEDRREALRLRHQVCHSGLLRWRQCALDHQPNVAQLITRKVVDIGGHELLNRHAVARQDGLDLTAEVIRSERGCRHAPHCTQGVSRRL